MSAVFCTAFWNEAGERSLIVPPDTDRAFVVFRCGGTLGALPLEGVDKITSMAELARPPGLPAPLAGFLNLAGSPVPVLRLDHLLHLPERDPGLYSMLVLVKALSTQPGPQGAPVAILVDRVSEILHIPAGKVLPVSPDDSLNGCVHGTIHSGGQVIHLLALGRILLEKERQCLNSLLEHERTRLANWEPVLS